MNESTLPYLNGQSYEVSEHIDETGVQPIDFFYRNWNGRDFPTQYGRLPVPRGGVYLQQVNNRFGRRVGSLFGLNVNTISNNNGMDPRVVKIRLMYPTDRYPTGYAVYYNNFSQPVYYTTGRTISSNDDPYRHIPLIKWW